MPQVRLRPPSREDQLKLKTNPFAPIAYTKYSHQLIDSHMHNHNKRILGAKTRIDMGTPESAVKCVKTRAKYYSPARIDLILDTSLCSDSSLGSLGMSQNSYQGYGVYKSSDFQGNRSIQQECITKTGKQTKLRHKKETNKSTPIPWRHTTRSECLGQKTNFPSLDSSVCASQLVTRREQRNAKYRHVKSKVKQLYFDKKEKIEKDQKSEEFESCTESEYSSDPDHHSELSDGLHISHIETGEGERNVSLGETFNIKELQITGNVIDINEITSPELNIPSVEPTIEDNKEIMTSSESNIPTVKPTVGDIMTSSELETDPREEFDLDLEYLKLKRAITDECVKLQIFSPAAILKVCERMTGSRSGLDPGQVSKMIGQILRELDID